MIGTLRGNRRDDRKVIAATLPDEFVLVGAKETITARADADETEGD